MIHISETFKEIYGGTGSKHSFGDTRSMELAQEITLASLALKFVRDNRSVYDKIIFLYFTSEKWTIFKS